MSANGRVIFSTAGVQVELASSDQVQVAVQGICAQFPVSGIRSITLEMEGNAGFCTNDNGAKMTASLDGGQVHIRLILNTDGSHVHKLVSISPNDWGKLYESIGDLKGDAVPETA